MANSNKYASIAQVSERYASDFLIRITNFTGIDAGESIIDARIDLALQDASDAIDGYLQGRYSVPLSPAPDFITPDTIKLAIKILVERKGYDPEGPDASHVTAGNEVIKKYTAIAGGDISISIPDAEGNSNAPARIHSSAPRKLFPCHVLNHY
jgi:phage gp36-like protein